MTNRLLDSVKLPYKITRGSYFERQQKADATINKLYQELQGRFKKQELTIDKMQECINETLPNHVRIIIKDCQDKDFDGFSDILYSPKSGKINATTIEIPTKNNKVNIKELPTIMHELQHVIDQLYHPKYLARNQHMENNKLFTEQYNLLYDGWLYNFEEPGSKKEIKYILEVIKQRLLEFLKGKPTSDKINYLQDCRYGLQMEEKAYFTQSKIAKKLKKKHLPINKDDLIKENKDYMFHEKIQLLKEMASTIIGKERAIHKSRLRKESIKKCK